MTVHAYCQAHDQPLDWCDHDGDDITLGGRITPANFTAIFTPQQAARIKADVFMLRCAADAESLRYSDRILDNDGGHRWFAYCLDIVARRS